MRVHDSQRLVVQWKHAPLRPQHQAVNVMAGHFVNLAGCGELADGKHSTCGPPAVTFTPPDLVRIQQRNGEASTSSLKLVVGPHHHAGVFGPHSLRLTRYPCTATSHTRDATSLDWEKKRNMFDILLAWSVYLNDGEADEAADCPTYATSTLKSYLPALPFSRTAAVTERSSQHHHRNIAHPIIIGHRHNPPQ